MIIKTLTISILLFSIQSTLPEWCRSGYYNCTPLILERDPKLDRELNELNRLQQQLLEDQRRDDLNYRLDTLQWDIDDLKDRHYIPYYRR